MANTRLTAGVDGNAHLGGEHRQNVGRHEGVVDRPRKTEQQSGRPFVVSSRAFTERRRRHRHQPRDAPDRFEIERRRRRDQGFAVGVQRRKFLEELQPQPNRPESLSGAAATPGERTDGLNRERAHGELFIVWLGAHAKGLETAAAATDRSPILAKNFPEGAAAEAEADWYRFVLVELNGIGTMLRFDAEEGGTRAGEISRRAQAMVDTLGWDPATAIKQAWAFVESELHEPHDAWGPHLVLSTLGAAPDRLRTWTAGLAPEARAILTASKTP